jgi:hypothetical protein
MVVRWRCCWSLAIHTGGEGGLEATIHLMSLEDMFDVV